MRTWTSGAALMAVAGLAAGCGSTASDERGAGTNAGAAVPAFAKAFTAPASGCGSYTAKLPDDPDGVIAQLPKAQQQALGGYADFDGSTVKVLKSRWADWKPDNGPHRIAISWGPLVSDFQVQAVDRLKKEIGAIQGVEDVALRTTGSAADVGQQLQQFNTLLQTKPDLIVLQTVSADSFVGPVRKAAAQGIPVVTLLSPVPVDSAVNLDSNNFLGAADTASYLTKALGGKGKVLLARALAVAAVDSQIATGWKRVLKSCPGMKVAGEVFGGFSEAGAKSEVLKWLGTHPAKLDGVAVMPGQSAGTLQALKQSGREVNAVAEIGADRGFLGYWGEKDTTFNAASTTLFPVGAGRATAEVVKRMLDGQGVKLNTLVGETPLITDANLGDYGEDSWTVQTSGTVSGAPDSFLPSDEINAFFGGKGQ